MKVLVTVASKHGSTYEIAKAIGSELAIRGMDVSVVPVQDVRTIDEYDAVVLGSAIHMGQWMKPAKGVCGTRDRGPRLASSVVVLEWPRDRRVKAG